MFVSITYHPNRDEWRSLFLAEAEAQADADRFLALFPGVAVWARVEPATTDDASEYVSEAGNAEGEARAEYGSGAVSLGYDGAEAMLHYDGYRTSDDPLYAAASAMLGADASRVQRVELERDREALREIASDDIPF